MLSTSLSSPRVAVDEHLVPPSTTCSSTHADLKADPKRWADETTRHALWTMIVDGKPWRTLDSRHCRRCKSTISRRLPGKPGRLGRLLYTIAKVKDRVRNNIHLFLGMEVR